MDVIAIVIPIVSSWDGKGLARAQREIQNAEGGFGKAKAAIQGLNGPAMAAGGAIAAGMGVAIKAASDLEQAVGGLQAVFGDSSKVIEDFSKTAADQVGLSASEFDTLATKAGAAFKNMGQDTDEAAKSTIEMTKRASDMAAVFGGDVSTAMDAFQSGLKGEFDPLENYGVKLSAAAVQTRALAETGKESASQLTDQEKATATYNEVMAQTADTMGQWAAQQDTVGESTQTAQAHFKDAAAALGTALLPAVSDVMDALSGMAGFVQENSDVIVPLVGVIGTFAAAIIGINAAMAAWEAVAAAVQVVNALLGASWLAAMGPIAAVVAAIAGLVAAGYAIWRNWDTIKAMAVQIWGAIKNWLLGAWNAIKAAAVAVWNGIKAFFTAVWNGIVTVVRTYINIYRTVLSAAWNAIRSTVMAVWNGIRSFFTSVWNGIRNTFTSAVNRIKSWLSNAWNTIKSTAVNAFHSMGNSIFSTLNTIVSWIAGLPGRIVGALAGLGSRLFSIGSNAIGSLLSGLRSMAGSVGSFIGGLFRGRSASPAPQPAMFDDMAGRGMFPAAPPTLMAGAYRAGGSATYRTTVNVHGVQNPQEFAQTTANTLQGARIRTGWTGLRP